MKLAAVVAVIVYLMASCVPNTPTAPPNAGLPPVYRGAQVSSASLASIPWRRFYNDPVLQDLIARALVKNYTSQQAYAAVLAAAANLGITRANQLPQIQATLQTPYEVVTGDKSALTPGQEFVPSLTVGSSYEIDLFGKLASATAASRAQLFATQWAQNALFAGLVSQVATAYFQLLELDTADEITRRTLKVRAEDVRLMKLRVDYGQSSLQDLRQSQQSLLEVSEQLPIIHQDTAQTENALSVLTGDYPHDIKRGLALDRQVSMPALPQTGLPSELLVRRPDIKQAEYTLAAADAQVDVARKLLFPSLTFGASAGVSGEVVNGIAPNLPAALSSRINGIFIGPQGLFALLPSLVQAIFTGGKLQANVRLARAQQQQLLYSYLQTVQQAFQEVSNAVVAYNQQRLYGVQVDLYTAASLDSTRLANLRYEEGQTSYLEVLNAESRSYQAEINSSQARLSERLALVQLYLALGGGWQSS